MIVTINTDASFSRKHKLGAYAFWIVCDLGKMLKSGVVKNAESIIHCEMAAIANALFLFKKSDLNKGVHKIIINSDCEQAFFHIKRKSKYKEGSYIYRKMREIKYKSKSTRYPLYKFFNLRHVKAHTENNDSRSWVNNWCDKEAKKQLGIQLKAL